MINIYINTKNNITNVQGNVNGRKEIIQHELKALEEFIRQVRDKIK